jgi:hypothetical protein
MAYSKAKLKSNGDFNMNVNFPLELSGLSIFKFIYLTHILYIFIYPRLIIHEPIIYKFYTNYYVHLNSVLKYAGSKSLLK